MKAEKFGIPLHNRKFDYFRKQKLFVLPGADEYHVDLWEKWKFQGWNGYSSIICT